MASSHESTRRTFDARFVLGRHSTRPPHPVSTTTRYSTQDPPERRIELLRTLMTTDGAAECISALAAGLDRAYRTVRVDVDVLEDCGVLVTRILLGSSGVDSRRP